MDVRSISALNKYDAARPATNPEAGFTNDALSRPIRDFTATLEQGEAAAMSSMTSDADPHALVQALAQTELAVETAVTVRNKVVEAYQEILRMPV